MATGKVTRGHNLFTFAVQPITRLVIIERKWDVDDQHPYHLYTLLLHSSLVMVFSYITVLFRLH